jgi:hypothetical protein
LAQFRETARLETKLILTQGCQMEYFQTENPNLVKILEGLVGIFYGNLVNFPAIWYILWSSGTCPPVLVCCTKKKTANPDHHDDPPDFQGVMK